MHCTVCRLPSAYNRAVVDTVTEETLGCLCTSCIERFFGRSLSAADPSGTTCILCDRDGFYALPKWRCQTRSEENRIVIGNLDAPVADVTPRLCDRHYEALRTSIDSVAGNQTERATSHGE
jgi:hypothetical protein